MMEDIVKRKRRMNLIAERYETIAERQRNAIVAGIMAQFPAVQDYQHRAKITYDGSSTVIFKWHWPVGTFRHRMSALEIAEFILPHMPTILPWFSNHPQIYAEFKLLLDRLTTWPKQALDEVKPWIRRLDRTEEDEILLLQVGAKEMPKDAHICFDMGGITEIANQKKQKKDLPKPVPKLPVRKEPYIRVKPTEFPIIGNRFGQGDG